MSYSNTCCHWTQRTDGTGACSLFDWYLFTSVCLLLVITSCINTHSWIVIRPVHILDQIHITNGYIYITEEYIIILIEIYWEILSETLHSYIIIFTDIIAPTFSLRRRISLPGKKSITLSLACICHRYVTLIDTWQHVAAKLSPTLSDVWRYLFS